MTEARQQRKPGRPPASSVDVPTSNRILQVAAGLFMKLGFDGVSMGQVADECNVTKAVVYYYFSSKANLFTVAMVKMMDTIRQRTLDILSRNEPLYDRLLSITITRLRIDAPLDFNSIMRGGHSVLTEEQIQAMHEAEEGLFETIAGAFRESIEGRFIRAVDPYLAARIYMALLMVGKAEQDRGLTPNVNSDTRAKQLLDFMWTGVGLAR